MAEAFPNSEFFGFDYHDASIERAREAADEAGVGDRVTFEVALGEGLSRATATTSLRSSTACTTWATRSAPSTHVRETLDRDGTWMIVEPFANDRVEDNLNPVGPRLLRRLDGDLHARRRSPRRSGSRSAPRPARRGSPR